MRCAGFMVRMGSADVYKFDGLVGWYGLLFKSSQVPEGELRILPRLYRNTARK